MEILPSDTVTRTLSLPPKPVAEPEYVPSLYAAGSLIFETVRDAPALLVAFAAVVAFAASNVPSPPAALSSASLTASMIPFELYVAPLTASTFVDCASTIFPRSALAFLNQGSSSAASRTTISAIFPSATVTLTVTVPLKPVPLPSYSPSLYIPLSSITAIAISSTVSASVVSAVAVFLSASSNLLSVSRAFSSIA